MHDRIFEAAVFDDFEEPNPLRAEIARLLAADDQSELTKEFVRVMHDPRPMLEQLRSEGVKPHDERAKIITLVSRALNHLGVS